MGERKLPPKTEDAQRGRGEGAKVNLEYKFLPAELIGKPTRKGTGTTGDGAFRPPRRISPQAKRVDQHSGREN